MTRREDRLLWVLAAALIFAGCGGDQPTSYRAEKESPDKMAASPSPSPLPTGEDARRAGEGASVKWTAPAGWKELSASGMRFASYAVPDAKGGKPSDLSVVTLPGDAGGELPNVNRWRGQLGLEPLDAAALATGSKHVDSKAGSILVVEFAGKQNGAPARMLAAILKTNDATWFFKLTGDDPAVAASRGDFLGFLRSLRPAR